MTGTTSSKVRERLNEALVLYLNELTIEDISDLNIDAVAQTAGVSRATAYRHFGDRDGLLFEAAIELTRRHAEILAANVAKLTTVAAKVEEAFGYAAREIKVDKILRMLLTSRPSAAIDAAIRAMSLDIMGQAYRNGQLDGQVRDDLSIDELIDWLAEQRQIVTRLELDEAQARTWVRRFVLPALRPSGGEDAIVPEIKAVLLDIENKMDALNAVVARACTSMN